jgi:ATP-dependent Lon protease
MTDFLKELPRSLRLPLVPLRELVVFPHLVVPLMLAREASLRAVRRATAGDGLVLLLSQLDGAVEAPGLGDFYKVGAVARVLQLFRVTDETNKVIVEAVARARVKRIAETAGEYRAAIEVIPELGREKAPEAEALVRTVRAQFFSYAAASMSVPDNINELVGIIDSPGHLADTVAAYVKLPLDTKQELLEEPDAEKRLARLTALLEHELKILKLQHDITDRVRGRIQKSQKDYFLREQMRAIEEELGQGDPTAKPHGELEAAIEKAEMPEPVLAVARRELQKLRRSQPLSPQSAVIEEYIHWLADLPWQKKTEDNLDLKHARAVLDAEHYGLEDPKQRILEYLAVKRLTADSQHEPILCLIGPPGVGKTSLARSVALALGRKFVRKSLGGVRDEAEIRGHRRTYVGAMPGRIIQSLRKAGSRNPVFLLDEIDKLAADYRGDPAAALLEVLDPDENNTFSDHYLEVEFDLSDVLFITTANLASAIPPVLRDRMEVIELGGYTLAEKLQIARRHLLPRQFKAHGLTRSDLKFPAAVLTQLIEEYTSEAGLRTLNKRLADVCRKVAAKLAEKVPLLHPSPLEGEGRVRGRKAGKLAPRRKTLILTAADLAKHLGPPPFRQEVRARGREVGAATGLAWTEAGGRTMTVEASWMRGKGRITLTGQLGDVMQESARAAVTFVRSHAESFALDARVFDSIDLHLHVPEGATPKDGPSAGLAMVAAVVSALTGKPVRRDVATTGEITLRGDVLAIGGLKEKVLAAHRQGIRTIVVPESNRVDLPKIPEEVSRITDFIFVRQATEALAVLVPGAPAVSPSPRALPAIAAETPTELPPEAAH